MNALRTICLLGGIFALACAGNNGYKTDMYMQGSRNSVKNSLRPTDWLSTYELESLPSFYDITFEKLEHMPMQEAADMLNKMYHLSHLNVDMEPMYTPKASEIWVYMFTPNQEKMSIKLSELPQMAAEKKYFGNHEVTIFITGMPQESETVKKATRKLVEAYMQRYSGKMPAQTMYESSELMNPSSSEEVNVVDNNNMPSGILIVVDLGSAMPSFKHYATMDIEETGTMLGNMMVQLTDKTDIAHETIHVIGSNMAAHVAGAAGRQYARQTGHQMRRITGLDPSKMYFTQNHYLTGLARGDAEFVDVIHTSAYGMGTHTRYGNADFYPNGPNVAVPGADNIVEASMRAVRYYAESVVPGNERNFPAMSATSMEEYKNRNGYGRRVYMGINTDYDVEGDFVLEVNAKSPFGRMVTTHKQQHHYRNMMPSV